MHPRTGTTAYTLEHWRAKIISGYFVPLFFDNSPFYKSAYLRISLLQQNGQACLRLVTQQACPVY